MATPAPPVDNDAAAQATTTSTSLTFLFISGHRRTLSFDASTSIARVKELLWAGWDTADPSSPPRPLTPLHIRLLHLGKILHDDQTLDGLGFPSSAGIPTVVHLSIRPDNAPAPTPGGPNKKVDDDDESGIQGSGCCCVIA